MALPQASLGKGRARAVAPSVGAPTKAGRVKPAPVVPAKALLKTKRPITEDDAPDSDGEIRRRPRGENEDDDDDREFADFDEDAPTSSEGVDEEDSDDDDGANEGESAGRRTQRRPGEPKAAVAPTPSIPLPVKELPKLLTIEERAAAVEVRLKNQSADFLKAYNDSFDMSWVFHDTGLEGAIYTFEELRNSFRNIDGEHLDSNVLPIQHAIQCNQRAIKFIREMVQEKGAPITLDLIRTIYVTLHPDEGDIKTAKYRRDIPQHRLYFHEYAAPDKIALKLRALVDWLTAPETTKTVGALKLAAKAHYELARIYPFPKDSGKVSRLLMNLILMRGGFPPAIMHHSERQRYYDSLKAPAAIALVQMVADSVENSISSIEKLLDEHESRTRAFIS